MTQIINNNCDSNKFIREMNEKFNIIDLIKPDVYDFTKVCDNVISSILGSYKQMYSSEIIQQLLFQVNVKELHEKISEILHLHLDTRTIELKNKSLKLLKKGKLNSFLVENNILGFISSLQKIDRVFYLSNKTYTNSTNIYPYGKSFVVNVGLKILSTNYITNMKISNTIINKIIMNDNKKEEFINFYTIIKNIGYYNESIWLWFKIFICNIINKKIIEIKNNHPIEIYNKITNFLNTIEFIKKSTEYFTSIDPSLNEYITKKLLIDATDSFFKIIHNSHYDYLVLNFLANKIDSVAFLYHRLHKIDDSKFQIKNIKLHISTYLKFITTNEFTKKCTNDFNFNKVNDFIEILTKVNNIISKLGISSLDVRITRDINNIISKNNDAIENICKYIHFNIINSEVLVNFPILNDIISLNESVQMNFIKIYKKYLIKRVTSHCFDEEKEKRILNILKRNNNYKFIYGLFKIIDDVVKSKGNITHYKNLEFIKTENIPTDFNRDKFNTVTISYNIWESVKNNHIISDNHINELYDLSSKNNSQLLTYMKSYQIFYNKLYQKNHKITKWYIMNGHVKLDYNYESGTCELITLPIHTFILELFNNTDSVDKKSLLDASFWGNSNNKELIMKNLTASKILLFDGMNFKINTKWKPMYSPFNIINFSNSYEVEEDVDVVCKERVISNQLVIESNILSIVKKTEKLNSEEIYNRVEKDVEKYFSLSKEEFDKSLDNLFEKEYIIATEDGIFYNTY